MRISDWEFRRVLFRSDRIVDEQAERQDQRAERDPVEIAPGGEHDDEDTRKRERHGCRDDDTDAPTKAEQADQDYHDERDEEFQHELAVGLVDVHQLVGDRSEEHTSELPSLMRISYAGFVLKKKTTKNYSNT